MHKSCQATCVVLALGIQFVARGFNSLVSSLTRYWILQFDERLSKQSETRVNYCTQLDSQGRPFIIFMRGEGGTHNPATMLPIRSTPTNPIMHKMSAQAFNHGHVIMKSLRNNYQILLTFTFVHISPVLEKANQSSDCLSSQMLLLQH